MTWRVFKVSDSGRGQWEGFNPEGATVPVVYAVVGCSECRALWIVEGRPETTSCRRCGTRHVFESLRRFVETEHREEARTARAALLSDRSDDEIRLEDFSIADDDVADPAVDADEYLAAQGIDPDAVADAVSDDDRPSGRRDVVRAAIRDLEEASRANVIAYGSEHGVQAEAVDAVLKRLERAGEVTTDGGTYRLL